MTDIEEQFSQTRIRQDINLSGVSVDHLLKWRNIMQKALDEFEEETGHRVSICAVDWTLECEEPPEEVVE